MVRLEPAARDGRHLRIAVIRSRFNATITQRLLDGALAALREAGVAPSRTHRIEVPGAVELAFAADLAIRRYKVDAVVCLGAVVRGETDHYDYVCRIAADSISRLAIERKIPIAFGVLTCATMRQALARSGKGKSNRGRDAALVALEMAQLVRRSR